MLDEIYASSALGREVRLPSAGKNPTFNTSTEATCAESVYEIQLTYEKTYHSYFRTFSSGRDVSQLLCVKERNDDDDHHSRRDGHDYSERNAHDHDAFG
jgi:hypothetical protein